MEGIVCSPLKIPSKLHYHTFGCTEPSTTHHPPDILIPSVVGESMAIFYNCILTLIIHQIFSFVRDWSKRVTWAKIPQLKLGNICGYSPIFKTACVVKKI